MFVFWDGVGEATVESQSTPFQYTMLENTIFLVLCRATRMHLNLPWADLLSPLSFSAAFRRQAALISPYNVLSSNFGTNLFN